MYARRQIRPGSRGEIERLQKLNSKLWHQKTQPTTAGSPSRQSFGSLQILFDAQSVPCCTQQAHGVLPHTLPTEKYTPWSWKVENEQESQSGQILHVVTQRPGLAQLIGTKIQRRHKNHKEISQNAKNKKISSELHSARHLLTKSKVLPYLTYFLSLIHI